MNSDEDDNAVHENTNGDATTTTVCIASWSDLTYECLINILSRLTLADRWLGPMFVCKSWFNACKDPSLHSTFDLETHFKSFVELPRWWTPDFERKMDSVLRSVIAWSDGSLTKINTRHCSDFAVDLVAERCPSLEVLSIKTSPNVTDASMIRMAFRCKKLLEIDISNCYEISHESLEMIGRSCPNLKVLKRNMMDWSEPSPYAGIVPEEYLHARPRDGDLEAAAIAKFMPNLVHLELQFSRLSLEGLASICKGCSNLEYLDLSGCLNIRNRDINNVTCGLKSLKEIKKHNIFIPSSAFLTERYDHWRLYDDRFRTDIFRI